VNRSSCNTRRPHSVFTILGVGLLLSSAGCSSVETEPDSALLAQPAQSYELNIVWECMIEAAEAEGFELPQTDLQQDEGGGFTTNIVTTFTHPMGERTDGARLRVRIGPRVAGSGARGEAWEVALAASSFRKNAEGEWTWVGHDEALARRFWNTYEARVALRYEGGR
jgi:hypothetical protein